jgi:hypothetical protein
MVGFNGTADSIKAEDVTMIKDKLLEAMRVSVQKEDGETILLTKFSNVIQRIYKKESRTSLYHLSSDKLFSIGDIN